MKSRRRNNEGVTRPELAELYETGGSNVAPELSLLRDSVSKWANDPVDADQRARMRQAVLLASKAAETDEVSIAPVSGYTWILRNGSERAVPVSSITGIGPGTRVAVPDGSRAQFHYSDGSLVLLGGGSEVELGKLGRGNDAARLGRGRLFAWVAPQSGGAFGIRTPRGSVSVVGTEFDLGLTPTGALDLLVASGTVSFRPRGAGSHESRSLTAGHWLSFKNGSPSVRTLTPSQVRSKTAWARDGGPKHNGTGSWWKAVLVVVIIVMAIVAFFYRDQIPVPFRGEKLPPAQISKGTPRPIVPVQFNGDQATFRSPLVPGTAQVLTVQIDKLQGAAYQRAHLFTVVARALESKPDGSVKVNTTLREEATPQQSATAANTLPEGIDMWVHPDGSIDGIRVVGKDKIDADTGNLCLNLIIFWWNRLLPDKPVRPGEQYERTLSCTFPQHPSASFSTRENVRYEGLVTQAGTTLARFTYTGSDISTDIILQEQRAQDRLGQTKIDKLQHSGTGEFFVDVKTGRVVRRDSQDKTSVSIASYVTANGKTTGPFAPRTVNESSQTHLKEVE